MKKRNKSNVGKMANEMKYTCKGCKTIFVRNRSFQLFCTAICREESYRKAKQEAIRNLTKEG